MSNEIKYGLICEDKPQRIFIEKILPAILLLLDSDKTFIEDNEFRKRFGGASMPKQKVLKLYVEACSQAMGIYDLDVCFVGVDLDDNNNEKFLADYEVMRNSIHHSLKNSSIIFIPIQCVEHWLMHIKWNKENPNSTKNIPHENTKRIEAKREIYGSKVADAGLINELLNDVNLEWLISHSFSFNHFYKLVKDYLNSIA
jgi:hypothetical protein